ncbi:MAG: sulfotransferase, partial [Acidimicrobiales bacterium]|nr:sulfotransferase [Acidimicrobiales bacterium]
NASRGDGEGISAYLSHDEVVTALRRYCDSLFATARDAHAPDATWFVEKSPPHTGWVPAMAAVYPDAWFIHLLRDGRDVVRSLLAAPFGTWDVGLAAKIWVDSVRSVRRQSWSLPRFREIRYEDLLADPTNQMQELFAWLGLDVDPTVADALVAKAAREVVRFGSTDPVGAGKWTSLAPEELAVIDAVGHDLLAELGYLGA